MTEKEKRLYNSYLIASKVIRKKPFTLRKNFSGFEDSDNYFYLKKISNFLDKYPQIKQDLYFQAPYALYKDTDFFPLQFFASQKAIKTYTLYLQEIREQSPDSDAQMQLIKDSLRFIANFCLKNKIPIEKYITYKPGITYAWTVHLREHKITIYSLFEFPELYEILKSIPLDEKSLLLDDIDDHIHAYKNRYNNSTNAKNLVQTGIKKLSFLLKNQ